MSNNNQHCLRKGYASCGLVPGLCCKAMSYAHVRFTNRAMLLKWGYASLDRAMLSVLKLCSMMNRLCLRLRLCLVITMWAMPTNETMPRDFHGKLCFSC